MAVSANDEPTTLDITEDGAPGLPGTDGADGAGFNQVRMQKINNPLLHVLKTNEFTDTVAPSNDDTDLPHTRATSATYKDRYKFLKTAGVNVIREGLSGWIIEGSSDNLALYSEDITNAAWTKSGVVLSNTLAPDDSNNADSLTTDTSNSTHSATQPISFIAGNTYTVSGFFKSDGYDFIRLQLTSSVFGATSTRVNFDLSDGTAVSGETFNATYKIEEYANSYYRVSITASCTSTAIGSIQLYIMETGDGSTTFTGDGVSGVDYFGIQAEIGERTAYIPTTASSATRAQDFLSCAIRNNFIESSYTIAFSFNLESVQLEDGTTQDTLYGFSGLDSTNDNRSYLSVSATNPSITVVMEGDVAGVGSVSVMSDNYLAITFDGTTRNIYLNGALVVTDVPIRDPSKGIDIDSTLQFGARSVLSASMFGALKDFRIYDFAINEDEVTYLNGV